MQDHPVDFRDEELEQVFFRHAIRNLQRPYAFHIAFDPWIDRSGHAVSSIIPGGWTSFFCNVITRENIGGDRASLIPPDDCANVIGIGGITVSNENGKKHFWVGRKNPEANEIGGGQIHVSPAGYANPTIDFGFGHTQMRELLEEMLRWRNAPQGFYSVLVRTLTKEILLDTYSRQPFELASRIVYAKPFGIIDRVKHRNPWILYLAGLDMGIQEIQDSFRAHKLIFKAFPQYKLPRPEFDTMEPVEMDKPYIEDWYTENSGELRPHARGSVQALLMNWDYANAQLDEAFERRASITSTNF